MDVNYNRHMPVPSAEHLTEILIDLYENPEKRKQVADACFTRATDTKYQWDTIAQQFGNVFQETLNPPEQPKPKVRRRRKTKAKEAVTA